MSIGVGIITTPNRDFDPASLRLSQGTELFVHTDTEFKGVAYSRNECIKHLYDKGCDYIAICDDDLIFNRGGWERYTALVMAQHGIPYVCLPHTIEGTREQITEGVEKWDSYIGAFYMLTRRVIKEVGYFSPAFKGYGFEDTHYKHRLKQQYGPDIFVPNKLPYYVMSMDVLHQNPPPSITDKKEQIAKNSKVCSQEIANGIIYYPYTRS